MTDRLSSEELQRLIPSDPLVACYGDHDDYGQHSVKARVLVVDDEPRFRDVTYGLPIDLAKLFAAAPDLAREVIELRAAVVDMSRRRCPSCGWVWRSTDPVNLVPRSTDPADSADDAPPVKDQAIKTALKIATELASEANTGMSQRTVFVSGHPMLAFPGETPAQVLARWEISKPEAGR